VSEGGLAVGFVGAGRSVTAPAADLDVLIMCPFSAAQVEEILVRGRATPPAIPAGSPPTDTDRLSRSDI